MMSLTPDRQGYLGDLSIKTLPQLKELLQRQEKLLSDKPLIQSLGDKGEKVEKFAQKLREMIKFKTHLDTVALKSDETQCENLLSEKKKLNSNNIVSNQYEDTILQALLTRNEENHILIQRQDATNAIETQHLKEPSASELGELSSNLQQLKLGAKTEPLSEFPNSYERVIKKAAENTNMTVTPKFMPSRSLKFPLEESPSLHHKKANQKTLKPLEESAANPPNYTHQSTQLISIEESVNLIQEQKKRNEFLIAERAAQRLAQQFGLKMGSYSPAIPDMQYRDTMADHADEAYDSDDVPSDTENDID